jgi:hypothetical protein
MNNLIAVLKLHPDEIKTILNWVDDVEDDVWDDTEWALYGKLADFAERNGMQHERTDRAE